MNNQGLEVVLSSDGQYEQLTAEIFCDGKFVALISQDDGPEALKIEFPANDVDENSVLRKIDLATFEQGIERAKTRIKS